MQKYAIDVMIQAQIRLGKVWALIRLELTA